MPGGGQVGDFLHVVSDAYQQRTPPPSQMPSMREGAIVEAFAHADAMTAGIKTNQRQEYDIQLAPADPAPGNRLADAIGTACSLLAEEEEVHAARQ